MTIYSNTRDVTAVVRYAQPIVPAQLLFMCGHKGHRAGAKMRGNLPLLCAACVAKKAAA